MSRCDQDSGGPNVPLTRPRRVRHILGDGNCIFRSLSYIITGSEAQHLQVREALNHLVGMMIGHHISGQYTSVVEYIRGTNMDRNGTWGTDIELITASHMLNTSLSMYDIVSGTLTTYGPHNVDRSLSNSVTEMSMYIRHPPDHVDVVCSVV